MSACANSGCAAMPLADMALCERCSIARDAVRAMLSNRIMLYRDIERTPDHEYRLKPADYYGAMADEVERLVASRYAAPVLTPEASRILDAARALPVALEGSEAVGPWMGLAHVVEAVRAEAAALARPA